ncbi:hypothetical protein [Streptosporangium sp. NPDC049046]|uniref:hypothetical protein n=1 Tax=unclassified Streptosporangium TaxID=2632669 RepID=UPI003427B512
MRAHEPRPQPGVGRHPAAHDLLARAHEPDRLVKPGEPGKSWGVGNPGELGESGKPWEFGEFGELEGPGELVRRVKAGLL